MGCDIHMRAEVREASEWRPVGAVFDSGWREDKTAEPWDGRNYDLFAILADVRNGHGFAGIPTGDGFNPIAEPRGIPEDAAPESREFLESYDVDGHSHSWHTLADLLAYDWEQVTRRCGVIPAEEYERRQKSGESPEAWSGGISGRGIVTFSEEGYERWKADGCPDPGLDDLSRRSYEPDARGVIERPMRAAAAIEPYVRTYWSVTYREAVGKAWWRTVEALGDLIPEGGTAEDVRIVFFFDN